VAALAHDGAGLTSGPRVKPGVTSKVSPGVTKASWPGGDVPEPLTAKA
jgi:hypothetical protein